MQKARPIILAGACRCWNFFTRIGKSQHPGTRPTDTDPRIAMTKDDYSLETNILSTNHYQIELLTNLDQTPESGAPAVVSFPKPKVGSGFPARVFAILP